MLVGRDGRGDLGGEAVTLRNVSLHEVRPVISVVQISTGHRVCFKILLCIDGASADRDMCSEAVYNSSITLGSVDGLIRSILPKSHWS